MLLVQWLIRADHLLQVHVHPVADQVEVAPVGQMVAADGQEHFAEADEVRVRMQPKVLQDGQLA